MCRDRYRFPAAGVLQDSAGNNADITTMPSSPNRLRDFAVLTIDGVMPEITDITADSTPDGSYPMGTNIDVTVHFNKPVSLTGGPINAIFNNGGTMVINNFAPCEHCNGDLYRGGIAEQPRPGPDPL